MGIPVEITLRGIAPYEEEAETEIRKRAAKLDGVHRRIQSCRVVVEVPHKHRKSGNVFDVRIEISIPGKKVVVNREHALRKDHSDVRVAIRDAFAAARRRLEERSDREQREVKAHETPPHGHISSVFAEQDYGFIQASDGYEVYFHRNSVVEGDFDRMSPGDEVRYVEVEGEKGPQASTVRVTGKHHVIG